MKLLIYTGTAVVIVPLVIVLIGALLPKAHVAQVKRTLAASPHDVFQLIAGHSEWRGVEYERLVESPLTWRETYGRRTITYERIETIEPSRIVNRIADPKLPFGGTWTYEIQPAPQGTELTITEKGEVYNPLFRFVSRFIMGHTATVEAYQKALAAHLQR